MTFHQNTHIIVFKKINNYWSYSMHTAANPISRTANGVSPFTIEEDSMPRKVISCIPLIGIFFSASQENSLANQISCIPRVGMFFSPSQENSLVNQIINTTKKTNLLKLVELINIKNQYKVTNVVRNLLTVVLVMTGIANGFFGGIFALSSIILHIGMAGQNIYKISQNKQIVNELQATGYRQGMQVT